MTTEVAAGPAARVLAEAERRNEALGHENLGALSATHGFLARRPPRHDLPAPHDAWVEAVDELPDLCRTLTVRRRLEELPALDAARDALEDRHLLRAASVLGLLAHAYANVPMRKPEGLPEAIVRPWLQTAERLGRPAFTLTNSDYIFDNWCLLNPHAPDPMRVENLRLLNAIWDHPEMDTFILVLVELLAQAAPLTASAARAQEACLARDDDALKAELALMAETVDRLTHESLPKISANTRAGPRRVDPVLWTKLFAMIPLPVEGAGEDARNASGAETPYFHLMDVVLGRRVYDSELGHEALAFRRTHPPNWRDFLTAVGEVPIAGYVRDRGDRELSALFAELAEAYHGRHGILARHRLKAFAYMDAAFKTGRSSTVTGFTGLFEDRAWERVDASFEAARLERERSAPAALRLARVHAVDDLCRGARRLALDVRGLGMRCEPGHRCAVLPENEPALVKRTLNALHAGGDEPLDLTPAWMDALAQRPGRAHAERAPVRDVLAFGQIRPVPRAAAKRLHALTGDKSLRTIIDSRLEGGWDLADLLELLTGTRSAFTPQRLWQSDERDAEAGTLCHLVPPLEPRLYSVSGLTGAGHAAETIGLTVERRGRGTASTYLWNARPGDEIPVSTVPAPGFSLPADRTLPVVMVAEGIGIAPFVGFLQARARTPGPRNLLFAGAATPDALPHRKLLERLAARGDAEVHFAFAQDGSEPRRIEERLREPVTAARLPALLCPRSMGGAGARMYVCGSAAFARGVMEAVAEALEEPGRPGSETLADLIVQHRYVQEVLPGHTRDGVPRREIDASELAWHTSRAHGVWAAIGGRVCDLTAFAAVHPGGEKIIRSFAGMDATASYRIVEHHRDPAVDAMLSMFEIGTMRRLALPEELEGLFRRWVGSLYLLVEIENAHRMDTSIRSEPLNRGEYEGARTPTPLRLQFDVEAHGRFVRQTLPIVCRRFARLWQVTSGPCSASAGESALGHELDEVLAGPAANAARERCEELERSLERAGATTELDARLVELEAADSAYLTEAKALMTAGVRAFERHEADVLAKGSGALLDALRGLPALTSGYLQAVSWSGPAAGTR